MSTRIEYNGVFVNENELSMSLNFLHARITPVANEKGLSYRVILNDGDLKTIFLDFPTLEKSFEFTMSIKQCPSIKDALTAYREFISPQKGNPRVIRRTTFVELDVQKDPK